MTDEQEVTEEQEVTHVIGYDGEVIDLSGVKLESYNPPWVKWVIVILLFALAAIIVPQQVRVARASERNTRTAASIQVILDRLDQQGDDLKCFAGYTTDYNYAISQIIQLAPLATSGKGLTEEQSKAFTDATNVLKTFDLYAVQDQIVCPDSQPNIESVPPTQPPP